MNVETGRKLLSYRSAASKQKEKRKIWFYKMLFSYLPVIFFVSSVLFLSLFLAFSEHIRQTTAKSNEFFVKQMNQSVNNVLSPIDKMIVKEMLTNDKLTNAFENERLEKYSVYEVSQVLKNLILTFPIIESAYIFRQNDRLVISDSTFISIDRFSDRDFIRQQLNGRANRPWTGKREYFNERKNAVQPVVSLVKKYPFYTGDQGLVVINIRVDTIRDIVAQMSDVESSIIRLYDGQGALILTTERTDHPDSRGAAPQETFAVAESSYTGWTAHSGFYNGSMFRFFAVFPYLWVALGALSVVIGIVWIVYITRRNYKPIETIMNRLGDVLLHKRNDLFAKGSGSDEIRFIGMAIEDLMEQANKFQNRHEEDLIRIRKTFFKEIVEGNRPIEPEEWKREMERLGFQPHFDTIVFNVLEIDKYHEFTSTYSNKDQYLLKFVLNSVVHEIAPTRGLRVWTEWLSNDRLGMLYTLDGAAGSPPSGGLSAIEQMSQAAVTWIMDNLNFTVTIAIGGETDRIDQIPDLYDHALQALKYKPVLGHHRVIRHGELLSKPKMEIFNHVQFVSTFAHSFRSGNPAWASQLREFYRSLRHGMFPREDIVGLIHYFIYNLDRSMNELSDKLQDAWKQRTMPALSELLERFETLEEFEERSFLALQTMASDIQHARDHQTNYQLMHQVRRYIDENYANPDLSLNHLSQEFNLSPSYLSQLFKEEFGDKFIDYLVEVRIAEAKKRLQQTSDPIQAIAQQVGYVHSFSFIRAFKKLVGQTPGEFRK